MYCDSISKNNLTLFFPYKYNTEEKRGADLIIGLFQYILLLKCMEGTYAAIQNRDWQQFDALVKENACQIRAIKVAAFAKALLGNNELGKCPENIKTIREQIEVLTQQERDVLMRQGISLKQLLVEKKWEVTLSDEQMFLMEAFILAQVRVQGQPKSLLSNGKTDMTILNRKFGSASNPLSSCFLSGMENRVIELLSKASVNFLAECAATSDSEEIKQYLISEKYLVVRNKYIAGRPMFWSYGALLKWSLKQELPILFKVKKGADAKTFFFKANMKEGRYQFCSSEKENPNIPVIVVEGISTGNLDDLKGYDPVEVILANAAVHKQYVEPDRDSILPSTPLWEEFKAKGIKWGCTLENQNLFFIQHVICSTLGGLNG